MDFFHFVYRKHQLKFFKKIGQEILIKLVFLSNRADKISFERCIELITLSLVRDDVGSLHEERNEVNDS
jgi:hypothetical protein